MPRKTTPRSLMIEMLESWGEWERDGLYSQFQLSSRMGRLIESGFIAGGAGVAHCSGFAEVIPREVSIIRSLLVEIDEVCSVKFAAKHRANLRRRYVDNVIFDDNTAEWHAVNRSISLIVSLWLKK